MGLDLSVVYTDQSARKWPITLMYHGRDETIEIMYENIWRKRYEGGCYFPVACTTGRYFLRYLKRKSVYEWSWLSEGITLFLKGILLQAGLKFQIHLTSNAYHTIIQLITICSKKSIFNLSKSSYKYLFDMQDASHRQNKV